MNKIYFKNSQDMKEINDNSIQLIITSPPYFNIKDYSKNGYQNEKHSKIHQNDLGYIKEFEKYINELLITWKECYRVLKPNGKLCINVPLMPMKKKDFNTHYNRHIFDLKSSIQESIIKNTNFFLYDLYIWKRINSTKRLMFGSYPYPSNFYNQNIIEFIIIFVKDGKPENRLKEEKEKSKLTQKEWIEYTKQIWEIPIPNKKDKAFGIHSAIMPEEIVKRCIKLFSFKNDIILDPFTGSGTTLKVSKELDRQYVGYEIYEHYKNIIFQKLEIKEKENEN